MNRRGFLKIFGGAVVAAVAPSVSLVIPPAVVTPIVTGPPVLPTIFSSCNLDIREILTRNMLADIQYEEDRRFLASISGPEAVAALDAEDAARRAAMPPPQLPPIGWNCSGQGYAMQDQAQEAYMQSIARLNALENPML